MKRLLILLTMLQFFAIANAQMRMSITQGILSFRPCDTCEPKGAVAYNMTKQRFSTVIFGATQIATDIPDKSLNLPTVENQLKFFTDSSSCSISFFIPNEEINKTKSSDNTGYKSLEYLVIQNGKVIQEWQKIYTLQPEKEFTEAYGYSKNNHLFTDGKLFLSGEFKLSPGNDLLIKIRIDNTGEILQHLFIHRMDLSPEILTARTFPVSSSAQDILNNQVSFTDMMTIEGNELEVEASHSLLLSFVEILGDLKKIEYSYTGKPGSWMDLGNDLTIKRALPYYILIDNPEEKSKQNLYVRFKDKPEHVRHIKIKVKPKSTPTTWIKIAASIVLAALLFMVGFLFNKKRNKKQLQKLKRHKEELENKLQLLSGQFNPHFLFNTLNSIQNLVQKNETDKASDYISTVAAFLRTVMTISKKEYISLSEELDINETYLKLEQNRKPFHYEIIRSCSLDLGMIDFPPLLLQPVLENSIHHGIDQTEESALLISITIRCDEKNIEIAVKDNGKGYNTAAIKNGYGLDLAERRIKMINEVQPGRMLMQVNSSEKGTETIFMLKDWI